MLKFELNLIVPIESYEVKMIRNISLILSGSYVGAHGILHQSCRVDMLSQNGVAERGISSKQTRALFQ